jgi:DNA-binding transcriptional MocR family regulator
LWFDAGERGGDAVARPQKQIDPKLVKRLACAGLTIAEIAATLECSHDTIQRRFASELKDGRERMTSSLKRKQFAVAMKGNVGMLIWLGKQYLGQTERVIQQPADGTILNVTIRPPADNAGDQ